MPRRREFKYRNSASWIWEPRKNKTFVGLLLIFVFVWFNLKLLFYVTSDHCGGSLYLQNLCTQYWKRNAGGNLCHEICNQREQYMSNCDLDTEEYRTFNLGKNFTTKVLLKYLSADSISLDHVYRFPKEEANMTTYVENLKKYINGKLGPGYFEDIIRNLITMGDLNRDYKVNLAEARSLYSLLQINDFFISLVFRDSPFIPKLHGYCGDTYVTEYIRNKPLYIPLEKQNLLWRILPDFYSPQWQQRVKLSLGLIELASAAYQYDHFGTFYLCNISENTFGYTRNFEVKLLDLSLVLPKWEFSEIMKDRPCTSDEDCVYSDQCASRCDMESQNCSDELVRPSLYHVCKIIKPFLLPGTPQSLKGDLLYLFHRCSLLHYNLKDLALHHSLVYTHFKSLLWRQISNSIG